MTFRERAQAPGQRGLCPCCRCLSPRLNVGCQSQDLLRTVHVEVMRQDCPCARLLHRLSSSAILPVSTLGTLPCFLWGEDGLVLYFTWHSLPKPAAVGKQATWKPWLALALAIASCSWEQVIWAEAVLWALPTGQNYSGLSALLAKAPGGLCPLEVGWHKLLRAAVDSGAGFWKTWTACLMELKSPGWVSARSPPGLVTLTTGSLGVLGGVAAGEFICVEASKGVGQVRKVPSLPCC